MIIAWILIACAALYLLSELLYRCSSNGFAIINGRNHSSQEENGALTPQQRAEILLQKERMERDALRCSLERDIDGLEHIFTHIPYLLSALRMAPWNARLEKALRELHGEIHLLSGKHLERAIAIANDVTALFSSMPDAHDDSTYDKRILTPFMERCKELTPVVNELLDGLRAKKEENIEERGKEIRELPMKSLEGSASLPREVALIIPSPACAHGADCPELLSPPM